MRCVLARGLPVCRALRAQCLQPHGIGGQGIRKVADRLLAASGQQRGT